jgi:hypothetical protein
MSNGEPDLRDDLETTASVRRRWWATNDLLGAVLLLSLPLIIIGAGAQILALAPVPGVVLGTYLVVVGTATVWMFGVEALKAWRGE